MSEFEERLRKLAGYEVNPTEHKGVYSVEGGKLAMQVREGPGGAPVLVGGQGPTGYGKLVPSVYDRDTDSVMDNFEHLQNLLDLGRDMADKMGPSFGTERVLGTLNDRYLDAGTENNDSAMYVAADVRQYTPEARQRLGATHIAMGGGGGASKLSGSEMMNLSDKSGTDYVGRFGGTFFPLEDAQPNFPVQRNEAGKITHIETGSGEGKFFKRIQLDQVDGRGHFGDGNSSANTLFLLDGHGGTLRDGGGIISSDLQTRRTRNIGITLAADADVSGLTLGKAGDSASRRGALSLGTLGDNSIDWGVGGFERAELASDPTLEKVNIKGQQRYRISADISEYGMPKVAGPAEKVLLNQMAPEQIDSIYGGWGKGIQAVMGAPADSLLLARSMFEQSPELQSRYLAPAGLDMKSWNDASTSEARQGAWQKALYDAQQSAEAGTQHPLQLSKQSMTYTAAEDQAREFRGKEGYSVRDMGGGQSEITTPEMWGLRRDNYSHNIRVESNWQRPGVDAYALSMLEKYSPPQYERMMQNARPNDHLQRMVRTAGLNAGVGGVQDYAPAHKIDLGFNAGQSAAIRQQMGDTSGMKPQEYLEAFAGVELDGRKMGDLVMQGQAGKRQISLPSANDLLRMSSSSSLGEEQNRLVSSSAEAVRAAVIQGEGGGQPLKESLLKADSVMSRLAESKEVQRDLSRVELNRAVGGPVVGDSAIPEGWMVLPDDQLKELLPKNTSIDEFRQALAKDDNALLGRYTRYPNTDDRQVNNMLRISDTKSAQERWGMQSDPQGMAINQKTADLNTQDSDGDAGTVAALFDWKQDKGELGKHHRSEVMKEYGYTGMDDSQYTEGQRDQRQSWLKEAFGKVSGGVLGLKELVESQTNWEAHDVDSLKRRNVMERESKGLVGVATNFAQRDLFTRVEATLGGDSAKEVMRSLGGLTQQAVDFAKMDPAERDMFALMTKGKYFGRDRAESQNQIRYPKVYEPLKKTAEGWGYEFGSIDRSERNLAQHMIGLGEKSRNINPVLPELLARNQGELGEFKALHAQGEGKLSEHLFGMEGGKQRYSDKDLYEMNFLRTTTGGIMKRAYDQDPGTANRALGKHQKDLAEEHQTFQEMKTVIGRTKAEGGVSGFFQSLAGGGRMLGGHFENVMRQIGFDPAQFSPGARHTDRETAARALVTPAVGQKAAEQMEFGEAQKLYPSQLREKTNLGEFVKNQILGQDITKQIPGAAGRQKAFDEGDAVHKLIQENWNEAFSDLGTWEAGEFRGLKGEIGGRDFSGNPDAVVKRADGNASIYDIKVSNNDLEGGTQALAYAKMAEHRSRNDLSIPRELEGLKKSGASFDQAGDIRVKRNEFMALQSSNPGMGGGDLLKMAREQGIISTNTFGTDDPGMNAQLDARVAKLGAHADVLEKVFGEGTTDGFAHRLTKVGSMSDAVGVVDSVVKNAAGAIGGMAPDQRAQFDMTDQQLESMQKYGLRSHTGFRGQELGLDLFGDAADSPYNQWKGAQTAAGGAGGAVGGGPPVAAPPEINPTPGSSGGSQHASPSPQGNRTPPVDANPNSKWFVNMDDKGSMSWRMLQEEATLLPSEAKKLMEELPARNERALQMSEEYTKRAQDVAQHFGYDPETGSVDPKGRFAQAQQNYEKDYDTYKAAEARGAPDHELKQYAKDLKESRDRFFDMNQEMKHVTQDLGDYRKTVQKATSITESHNKAAEQQGRVYTSSEASLNVHEDMNARRDKAMAAGDTAGASKFQAESDLALDQLGNTTKEFMDPANKHLRKETMARSQLASSYGDMATEGISSVTSHAGRQITAGREEMAMARENEGMKRQKNMYALMSLQYLPFQLGMAGQWEFGADVAAEAYRGRATEEHGADTFMGKGGGGGEAYRFRNRAMKESAAQMALGRGREDGVLGMIDDVKQNEDFAYMHGLVGAPLGQVAGMALNAEMVNSMVMGREKSLFATAKDGIMRLGGMAAAGAGAKSLLGLVTVATSAPALALGGAFALAGGGYQGAGAVTSRQLQARGAIAEDDNIGLLERVPYGLGTAALIPAAIARTVEDTTREWMGGGAANHDISNALSQPGTWLWEQAGVNTSSYGLAQQGKGFEQPFRRTEEERMTADRVAGMARNENISGVYGQSLAQANFDLQLGAGAMESEVAGIGSMGGTISPYSRMATSYQDRVMGEMEGMGSLEKFQHVQDRSRADALAAPAMADAWGFSANKQSQISSRAHAISEQGVSNKWSDRKIQYEMDNALGITQRGQSYQMQQAGRESMMLLDPETGEAWHEENAVSMSAGEADQFGLGEIAPRFADAIAQGQNVNLPSMRQLALGRQQELFGFQQQQLDMGLSFGRANMGLAYAGHGLQGRQMMENIGHQQTMMGFQWDDMQQRQSNQWEDLELGYSRNKQDSAFGRETFEMQQDFAKNVQHEFQMSQFDDNNAFRQQMNAFQLGTMEMQNSFWNEERVLQGEMKMNQRGQQAVDRGLQRQQTIMGREWQMEDWDRNSEIGEREFGWRMEDYDEGIRHSKGRDKKRLMKDKERDVARHEDQLQQADTTQDRAKKSWELEDQRWKNNEAAIKKNNELEDRLWKMQTDHHNAMHARSVEAHRLKMAHEDQSTNKQREYYLQQFKFQQELADRQREKMAEQEKRLDEDYERNKTRLADQHMREERMFAENKRHAEAQAAFSIEQHALEGARLALQAAQMEANAALQQAQLDAARKHWEDQTAIMQKADELQDLYNSKLIKGLNSGLELVDTLDKNAILSMDILKEKAKELVEILNNRARDDVDKSPGAGPSNSPSPGGGSGGGNIVASGYRGIPMGGGGGGKSEIEALLRAILGAIQAAGAQPIVIDQKALARSTSRERANMLSYDRYG